MVHSRRTVTIGPISEFNYTFHGTNHQLKIKDVGISLIFSVVFAFLAYSRHNPSSYDEAILRKYFDDINESIVIFNDDISTTLLSTSSSLRLKRIVRYVISQPNFVYSSLDDSFIVCLYKLNSLEEPLYGVDYSFTINGDRFIVPGEALSLNDSKKGVIRVSDIECVWLARENFTFQEIR